MEANNNEKAKVCGNCSHLKVVRSDDGIIQKRYCELHRQSVFEHFKCSNNRFEAR